MKSEEIRNLFSQFEAVASDVSGVLERKGIARPIGIQQIGKF